MSKKTIQKVSDWQLIQLFFSYLKLYWRWVLVSLLAVPITTAATVGLPWLIVLIIDDYIVPGNHEGLQEMATWLAGIVFVGYLADAVYTYCLQRSGQLAITKMRGDLFSHALSLPRTYFDKHPIGVTLSRLTSDMEAIGESLAIGVLSLLTDFIKTIALLSFLFYLNWELTLLICLILPPIYFVVSYLRQKLRHFFNATRESLAEATAYLQECLNGIKTVQLYAAEEKVLKEFKKKNGKFFHAQTHSNIYDAILYATIEGLTSITMALLIWYGTGQILSDLITIGVLVGFINTLNRIFIPIREFAQQVALIQRALSALEHINELFAEKPEDEKVQSTEEMLRKLETFEQLEFKNVSFRYSPEGPLVLKNISFTLKQGQRIAIVGATGSGKSTVLRILTRTYENYQGSITLNGLELSSIPKKLLIRSLSLMQQDVYLFNETIRFNISLNRPELDEQAVRQAAEYVYAKDFIEAFPQGFDYQVVDNGKNLSSGQAQLLSFARSIAGRSDMILLDEATASVDSVTESLIQKAIEKIFCEKTVIAIAHRLSTIQNSDLILVMKEGQVVEQGDHQDLIGLGGYYLELLNKFEPVSAEPLSLI